MAGRPRNKMPIPDRAKQFMPFSALRGLNEALAAKERIVVPKPELSEEMAEELDHKLQSLQSGQVATIVYYHTDQCIRITGMIARIDSSSQLLQIVNTKIAFTDILDIIPE